MTTIQLSDSERERYFEHGNKKDFSLLSQDIKYARAFVKYIESHKKNGAPKMLFKPAMLTLGAIELVREGIISELDFRRLFTHRGILYTGVEAIFENKLDIDISFPLLNTQVPISDLTERIVRGLKLKTLSEHKRKEFIKAAKTLANTSAQNFEGMVAVGNRYDRAMSAKIYLMLLNRKDDRPIERYAYIDEFNSELENIFLQIQKDLNPIKKSCGRA